MVFIHSQKCDQNKGKYSFYKSIRQHFYNIISIKMQARNLSNLPQLQHKQVGKSWQDYTYRIAEQMGQEAVRIYNDIRKFRQMSKKLQKYSFPTLKYKVKPTQSNVCAKILEKETKAFKCHDCIFQGNSIMCMQCFQKSQHKGHIYELITVFGGCCDCGDQQKWDPKGSCNKHNNLNLVQEMKGKVDLHQEQAFIRQLSFCFVYWFILYNQAQEYLKLHNAQQTQQYKQMVVVVRKFGVALISYLSEFNKGSLISNIMTYDLLSSKVRLKQFELLFCSDALHKPIYQIIFNVVKLQQCPELIVNLFTQLFTIKQFRRKLTITFMHLHQTDSRFPMSSYSHLSCQLLTSHKLIRQLVQNKEIHPLTYTPKKEDLKSFQELARNSVRYYVDIEYLSRLYNSSSRVYLNYHIKQGCLPSLGHYRSLSYSYDQSINYYGVEEIYIGKLVSIMKVIKDGDESLPVLQKGIQDLFDSFNHLYAKNNAQLFVEETYEHNTSRFIYLTQEISLSLLAFTYFQKMDQLQGTKLPPQVKIRQLMKILNLTPSPQSKQKVIQTLQILHNSLIFSGLTLGHPQTMERFYTYYSFSFNRSYLIPSLMLYLYKLMILMLSIIQTQRENTYDQKKQDLSDLWIFQRPLRIVEEMFKGNQFEVDDESIFDRRKNMIRLNYFLNLLIQTSQTDVHELILANCLGFDKGRKYQDRLSQFYIQLLKNYKKIPVKRFKQIADAFFINDEAFQKFISNSKQILIHNGKIGLKQEFSEGKSQSQKPAQTHSDKIQSQLNLYYFRSLKNKLVNLSEKDAVIKVPRSENHFLALIISQPFVDKILAIVQSYVGIMLMEGGKIKQRQSAVLGQLVVQLLKISKALANTQKIKISNKISHFLGALQKKHIYLQLFTQEVIKILCQQAEHYSSKQSIQKLNRQAVQKGDQRKRKLLQKKNKKLAKYKQNQQKCQIKFSSQLKNIMREEMLQQRTSSIPGQQQKIKTCIICRQNRQQKSPSKSDLMLMGFMQLSDLYQHFLKGKSQQKTNCHLVFKTCGHYIHQQCHKTTSKNKQYNLCQLCKSTVNCFFPVSVGHYQQTGAKGQQLQQIQNHIYEQLKLTYSILFAIDDGLRTDCKNGFGKTIEEQRQIKDKLVQSLTSEILFSAIVNNNSENQKSSMFNKKMYQIYQNILMGLKVFVKGQLKEQTEVQEKKNNSIYLIQNQGEQLTLKVQHFPSKQQQEQNEQKAKKTKEYLNTQKTFIIQKDQQKKNVQQIIYHMQNYIRTWINNYIMDEDVKYEDGKQYLSQQCVRVLEDTLNGMMVRQKQDPQNKIQEQRPFKAQCLQIQLLRKQLTIYTPPSSLQNLFQLRGKCQNCSRTSNHIFICLICLHKTCRQCKSSSVYNHNNSEHNGNSIYLQVDAGNIYYLSKKKYWVYDSVYEDYLGYHFKGYENGIKLERFSLNQQRWESIKKNLLDYEVESMIRYEEYNKKRQFTGPI